MSTIKVDTITDEAGSGAPDFPNGMTGSGSALTGVVRPNDSPTFGDGTFTGDVGIGTTNPATALDVNGTVTASDITLDTGASSLLTFQDSTGTNGYKLRANVSSVADYGFLIEDLAGGDLLKVESDGTVTATAFAGDGSALTGVGGSTTYGAVGTYVFGRRLGSASAQAAFTAGSTYAGSTLYPAGISGNVGAAALYWSTSVSTLYSGSTGSAALSGTWRAMGSTSVASGASENPVTLFVRTS